MIPHKMIMKILYGNFEKCFLEWEKMASRKIFGHFLHANFFMFILLISNHTVFLVQVGINLYFWVFQKAEIALTEAARVISAFWKSHSCKLIPNRPFARSGHMVQNHTCWWASCAVGLPKQRQVQVDWYELHWFGSPTAQLAHQHVWFCTMWPDRAKGLLYSKPYHYLH